MLIRIRTALARNGILHPHVLKNSSETSALVIINAKFAIKGYPLEHHSTIRTIIDNVKQTRSDQYYMVRSPYGDPILNGEDTDLQRLVYRCAIYQCRI